MASAALLLAVALVPMAAVAQQAGEPPLDPRIQRLLVERNKAMQARDFDAAYRILQQILEIDPRNYRALFNMAIIHFMKKEYDQGLALLERAMEIVPDNVAIADAYARALRESGRVDEAIEAYRRLIPMAAPGSKIEREARRHLMLLELRQAELRGDSRRIETLGHKLIEAYPDDPSILYQVGARAAESEHYVLAEQAFRRLVERVPKSGAARFYLANVLESTGRNAEAEATFEAALERNLKPEMERAARIKYHTLVGLRLLNGDDVLLAKREFEKVLELDPNHVVANMNLGLILIEERALEEAARAFERVISVKPEELEARIRLATIYLDTAKVAEGVRELDHVVAADPSGSFGERARVLLQALEQRVGPERLAAIRQFNSERAEIEQALEQAPRDAAVLFRKGELLLRERKVEEARKVLEEVVALDPAHIEARIKLGALAEEEGRFAEAAEHYAIALSRATTAERVDQIRQRLWTVQSQLYMERKNYAAAEEALRDVLALDPENIFTLWALARLETMRGRLEEAVQWYDKVLALRPDNINARVNAAQLYERLGEEEKALLYYRTLMQEMGANEMTKKMAAKRADLLQRQINGFSYSIGYTLSLDDNMRLSNEDKQFDYRSDTSLSIDYSYKLDRRYRFKFLFSPSYQVYHVGQYDYLNVVFNPSLILRRDDDTYTVGWQRNNQYGVLRTDGSVIRTDLLTFNFSRRQSDRRFLQLNVAYHDYASETNPIFDATTLSAGGSLFERGLDGLSHNYGYNLTWKRNNYDFGADYAFVGHTFSAGLNKRYGTNLSAFASASLTYERYSNPDSITNYTIRRENLRLQLQLGGNYRFDDRFSFFASYGFLRQNSTLPVGLLTQQQVIEQASSLGTYQRNSLTFGIRALF